MKYKEVKEKDLVVGRVYYDNDDTEDSEKMEFIGFETDDNDNKIACLFKPLSDDSHYISIDGKVGFETWEDEEEIWYEEII